MRSGCHSLQYSLFAIATLSGPALAAPAQGLLAEAPPPGSFVSIWRVLLMLICLLPWLAFCTWVDKDTKALRRMRQDMWNAIIVGAGAVGFALWLLLPWNSTGLFAAGFGLWFFITVGACAMYVVLRNSKVDLAARVFTLRHIQSVLGGMGKKKEDRGLAFERVRLTDAKGVKVPPPTDPDQADAYEAAQNLLFDVLWRRATDADLYVAANAVKLQYKIDGVLTPRNDLLTPETAPAAISFLKTIAGLDAHEHRKPQEGSVKAGISGTDAPLTEIEVQTSGTTERERLAMRITGEQNRLRLADLGLSEKQLNIVENVVHRASGLVIISGPRASGVTTTLYASLRSHDAFMQNLLTLEYQQLMDLENITQDIFDAGKHEAGFARQLQTVLRREPDVVMVSDCPDRETAHLVAKAAADGKKVYMGIQARDAFEALKKIVSLAGDTDLVAQTLTAITNQRLVRKLCIACRQAYRPDTALLKKANLPADKIEHLYRPPPEGLVDAKGNPVICTNCQGSGYFGRMAVFEILLIDDTMREMIRAGQPVNAICTQARKGGMYYLQEVGLQKVQAGITSMNEVLRVMRDEEPPAPSGQPRTKAGVT